MHTAPLTQRVLRLLGLLLLLGATATSVVVLQARAQGVTTPTTQVPALSAQGVFKEVVIIENHLETRARLQVSNDTEATVAQTLQALGFVLDKPDIIYPSRESSTPWFGRIYIQRAPGVVLKADGKVQELKTGSTTVAQLLAERKVRLDKDDRVEPAKSTPIQPNMVVTVVRVETKEETEQEQIAFETTTQDDAGRYVGEQAIKTEGQNGLKEKKFSLVFEDGKEVKRELVAESVTKEPVTKVVLVGTKQKPAPPKPKIASGPAVGPYANLINDAAAKYGQNPQELMGVMLCESGGYRWADNGAGNLGLFQFSKGMWSENWNTYRNSDIFSTDQIYAAALAWSLGMRGRWGC